MERARLSGSDKLAIALACLSAAMALILFLIEKNPLIVSLTVFCIAALLVYPIIHFLPSRRFRIPALIVMIVLVCVFGWAVWPKKTQLVRTEPSPSQPPPVSSTSDFNRPPSTSAPTPGTSTKPKATLKAPEAKQAPSASSSGTNSPAIGSITQGSESAVSVNQQGGITAGTVNNFGTPLLPTATVTVCATCPDVVAGEDFQSVVTFTTSRQIPRPWFALFFDGPVLEGNVGRVKRSYGYTHGRAEKLPNPENSFIFRTTAMEFGGTSSWFRSDGPIRATVPSKGRVKLTKVLAGGGDNPDVALNVNLVFSCVQ
jgi:hypothetical protein